MRFSLRSLLLTTLLVACVVRGTMLWKEDVALSEELARNKSSIEKLEPLAGRLPSDSKDKLIGLTIRGPSRSRLQTRVNLPSDRTWRLCFGQASEMSVDNRSHVETIELNDSGVVDVGIFAEQDDQLQPRLRVNVGGHEHLIALAEEEYHWIVNSHHALGDELICVPNPGTPLKVSHWRFRNHPGISAKSPPLAVWIEPIDR